MTFYDDNFGHWEDMDDPDNQDFYNHVQKTNVEKVCAGCGRTVNIQPQYGYCNSCADKLERGMDLE
jgi:rRNA maturation endonuclease Nob1